MEVKKKNPPPPPNSSQVLVNTKSTQVDCKKSRNRIEWRVRENERKRQKRIEKKEWQTCSH